MISVGIIILNWNRKVDTLACLSSLENINSKSLHMSIYIVDNASADDSIEALNRYIDSYTGSFTLKLIQNDQNYGFAEGNNIGIRAALTDNMTYVLLLNNDTEVERNFMLSLITAAQDIPDGGAFSPKIFFAPGYEFHKDRYSKKEIGHVIWYAGGVVDWNNVYGENAHVDEVDMISGGDPIRTDFGTGAALLLRTAAVRDTGLLDKNYFMYLEDLEYCLRLAKKGWNSYYVPSSVIYHKVAQSSGIGSHLNDYFITRNRMLLGFSYMSLRTRFALVRESIRLVFFGRVWQKKGIQDFYLRRFGKGSWK
jgi:GT2 family glycosyltransferase